MHTWGRLTPRHGPSGLCPLVYCTLALRWQPADTNVTKTADIKYHPFLHSTVIHLTYNLRIPKFPRKQWPWGSLQSQRGRCSCRQMVFASCDKMHQYTSKPRVRFSRFSSYYGPNVKNQAFIIKQGSSTQTPYPLWYKIPQSDVPDHICFKFQKQLEVQRNALDIAPTMSTYFVQYIKYTSCMALQPCRSYFEHGSSLTASVQHTGEHA